VRDLTTCLALEIDDESNTASASPLYIQLPYTYAIMTMRVWGEGLDDLAVSLGPDGVHSLSRHSAAFRQLGSKFVDFSLPQSEMTWSNAITISIRR
jgi:hypothetical protein